MAKHSDDETPETPDTVEAPATAETPVTTPPAAVPAQPGNKGVIAVIAGGTAVVGLLVGLLIGWFAFDHDGGRGGRGDKDRMSQHHQSSGKGGQQRGGKQDGGKGGQQRGGQQDGGQQGGRMMPGDNMMPGAGGGQMMPGRGGQGGQQGSVPSAPNTAPTTPGPQATPQGLQQG